MNGAEELPGREVLALPEVAGFCNGFGGASGPVDRIKSAKSRSESSFVMGSRAIVLGERGPAVLGIGFGCDVDVSREIVEACVDVVGLMESTGLDRSPFRPFNLARDFDVNGCSGSTLDRVEFRKPPANSEVCERELVCHLGESGVL